MSHTLRQRSGLDSAPRENPEVQPPSGSGRTAIWVPTAQDEPQSRLAEFQRNAAFIAFIGIVVVAATGVVIDALRTVLIPLIWATFFALPLERTAKRLNTLLIQVFSSLMSFCRSGSPLTSVEFRQIAGRNRFIIQDTAANRHLLDRLRNPLVGSFCGQAFLAAVGMGWVLGRNRRVLSRPCRSLGCRCTVVLKCCQRRLKITEVRRRAQSTSQKQVNCVRENWCYYVGQVSEVDPGELHLQLFLDQGCCDYPAIVEGIATTHSLGEEAVVGKLEIDRTSPLSWALAILLVVILVIGGLCVVGVMLYVAANSFVKNVKSYELGVEQLINWLKRITKNQGAKQFWDTVEVHARDFLRSFLASYAESFLAGFSSSLFQLVLFFIYLLFWLFEPITVSSPVVEVFKTYLFLKSLVCLLFAALMSFMLMCLGCELWPLFFILTFVLNYIPEVGALIAGLVSLPAVLLDASAGSPETRLWKTLYLVIFGLLFKFVTGNIIEVHMYTTRGGEFMRMHSVVLMALIMVFGQMLGITGMFLSVPMVAAIKYYLLSADIPAVIVEPLLCFIEGDELAVHKNFVDKSLASRADLLSSPASLSPTNGSACAAASAAASGSAAGADQQIPGQAQVQAQVPMGEPLLLEMGGSWDGRTQQATAQRRSEL